LLVRNNNYNLASFISTSS